MADVFLAANTNVQVQCSENDLVWYGTSDEAKPVIVGHLIYVHDMSEEEARAAADAWVVTPGTAERA